MRPTNRLMNPLKSIWRKFRSLWQRREVKQEIDEELRFHLEKRTVDDVALGMAPEEAVRQGLGLAGVGLVLGLVAAFGATRLLRSFPYGVQPLDPLIFVTVLALLAAVVLFFCWLPARRAARVEPMEALRNE